MKWHTVIEWILAFECEWMKHPEVNKIEYIVELHRISRTSKNTYCVSLSFHGHSYCSHRSLCRWTTCGTACHLTSSNQTLSIRWFQTPQDNTFCSRLHHGALWLLFQLCCRSNCIYLVDCYFLFLVCWLSRNCAARCTLWLCPQFVSMLHESYQSIKLLTMPWHLWSIVVRVSNPGTIFQSRDFGIGKRQSRD